MMISADRFEQFKVIRNGGICDGGVIFINEDNWGYFSTFMQHMAQPRKSLSDIVDGIDILRVV